MDAFWSVKFGQIIVGALAAGLGFMLLQFITKYLTFSDNAKSNIARYGSILCAVIAVNLFNPLIQSQRNLTTANKVASRIDNAIAEAKPIDGKSALDVFRENAQLDSVNQLAKASDSKAKLNNAASQFLGFYLVNVRTRVDFCKELGVSIPAFVSEFTKINQAELTMTRRLFHESNDDQLYKLIQPAMEKVIIFAMKDLAAQYNVTETELCRSVETNAIEVAKNFKFASLAPEAEKILMAY